MESKTDSADIYQTLEFTKESSKTGISTEKELSLTLIIAPLLEIGLMG